MTVHELINKLMQYTDQDQQLEVYVTGYDAMLAKADCVKLSQVQYAPSFRGMAPVDHDGVIVHQYETTPERIVLT